MADEYSLAKSLENQDTDYNISQQQYVYITDSNNGSYQTQIIIDGAGISNSGKWLENFQSFISIPTVTTLVATEGLLNPSIENAFAVSLKNGFSNLIHSIEIQASNNAVVSTMSQTGAMINFKLLTEMSQDDVANLAPSLHFAKDNALGISYNGESSAGGVGECNNKIQPTLFDPALGYGKSGFGGTNDGRLARMENTSYDSEGKSIGALNQSGKDYCTRSADGKVVNYYSIVNVPLTMLSDWFKKTPMLRGVYYRITLNLNTNCTSQMTVAGGKFTSVSTSSQTGTVPYMISPIGEGIDIGTCTGLELSIGIAKNSINKTGNTYSHPTLQSCRLYASMLDMTPQAEQMYLSKSPTKVIQYNDFLSFQSLAIPAGGNLNQILTNSIAKARRLIGIPVLSGTVNYAGAGSVISPLASPFSSAPCTTASNPITNFNVLLSGSNLYQSNLNYSFEQFTNELRKTGAINGGLSLGLSSGLLNQNDFENGYRFIVADLSRTSSEATDNISRSIQVILTNSGDKPIDVLWFLEYQRSVEIDVQTGSLIA